MEQGTHDPSGIPHSSFNVPPFSYAWLSLDERDSDLVVFLRYFVAAIRTVFPEACVRTQELVYARQLPAPDLLAATLINEIALLPGPLVMVLDDYQAIQGEAVHELLGAMIQHWPQTMQMVLISRHRPPLPLARLRAKGQLTEIRSHDLRFTPEETAAYLRKALPAPLSQPALDLLEQHTEGWIAGLQLAALSLRGMSGDRALLAIESSGNADAAQYLVDEVLSLQPAAIQGFLLRTSILDRFCAPLCQAIAGSEEPEWTMKACMEWIERANLFVTALDQQGDWYRYHHLFQEMLQQRLRERFGPDEVNRLHRAAAGWLAERGLVDEALQHALAAGDLDLAAGFMEQGARDVLNRADRLTLERWLHLLPDEFIQNRPRSLMIKAWTLELAWRLDAQWQVMQQVEALIAGGRDHRLSAEELRLVRAQLLVLHSQAAFFGNQAQRAVALGQEALSLLPSSWTYVRGGAMLYLGLAMHVIGQGRAAERLLLDEYAAHSGETGTYAPRLLMTLCFAYYQDGQIEPVRRTAQVLLEQATRRELAILQGWANYFLGVVHYQQNDLDAARQHFDAVIQSHHSIIALAAVHGYIGLALTQQARGEIVKARQTVERLSQYDLQSTGAEGARTQSLRARLLLLQGDLEGALRWADGFTSPPAGQPLHWLEEPHLTKAHILLARGEVDDVQLAVDILDTLVESAQQMNDNSFRVEVLALRAVALQMQEKRGEALASLQQAVELARPGGFIRAFVDSGRRLHNMLSQLTEQGFLVETIQRILAAFPGGNGRAGMKDSEAPHAQHPSGSVAGTVEPLTTREREILGLLREPLSGKEIAQRLYISRSTFKRHTANIYGKLGVNSRWEAVKAAEALGVLPPH